MSTRPITALPAAEAANVTFDPATEKQVQSVMKRYPTARAAILPVLWICQERYGWISPGVVRAVAERLGENPAFVDGVVTFYTMYRTEPSASYVIQACVTLTCATCGGKELVAHLRERLGIGFGERTADGKFQLEGVQCLGACGSAPVVQVNDDYYENLTREKLDAILDELGARKE
jgi:NADH-quinone oxidoreductase subunit E